MSTKCALPLCTAFLVCREIRQDAHSGEDILVGLPTAVYHRHYPAASPLVFFARWTSAHGDYELDIQLQSSEGEIVWRDGPGELWRMADPLHFYDLRLRLCPIFPKPGAYDFVLLANNNEVARQRFHAELQ